LVSSLPPMNCRIMYKMVMIFDAAWSANNNGGEYDLSLDDGSEEKFL
jgi:hypothetical protein